MILLITYEKKTFLRDYKPLYAAIQSAGTWWHHMDNVWLIKTNEDTTDWYNKLAPHITVSDRLLIVEITSNYQGYLKQEAWDWLKARFEEEGFTQLPFNFNF